VIPARRAGWFPLVDSLRAIAALAIVGYHVAFVLGALSGEGAGAWFAQLQVGVPLFFAISGFLLYRPRVAAKLGEGRAPANGTYALRRALRIVPAYWVALVLIALVLGRDGVLEWPGGLLYFGLAQAYDADQFTGGIGQAWTLTVEVAFYAALPLLTLVARRLAGLRGEALLLGGLVAVSVVWRMGVLALFDAGDTAYFPLLAALPAQLDFFAGGMALAVLSVTGARGGWPAWAPWGAAAAAFATLALWTPASAAAVLGGHTLQLVIALGLLAPAVIGVEAGGALRGALGWRPLVWVGLVSYGVYLWHLDVLRELADRGAPGAVVAGAGLVLTLALGAASWYAVERNALRLGRRRTGAATSAPAAPRPLPTIVERPDA
jgi:peptidoglycan/LPS O-acetylase OafA/YrhL